ncbi:hypothetical protein TPAR_07958 [Tolypocladium paradoxum]|uniref:Uncharacterized protein n=1 Tax=Tolypocladium paradoxum TaxID=94208 RepID=A0A2S4KNT3_9HYPO|nr:hypothetical protein TPAR_07958 [Tolypocladium paradoxum]
MRVTLVRDRRQDAARQLPYAWGGSRQQSRGASSFARLACIPRATGAETAGALPRRYYCGSRHPTPCLGRSTASRRHRCCRRWSRPESCSFSSKRVLHSFRGGHGRVKFTPKSTTRHFVATSSAARCTGW